MKYYIQYLLCKRLLYQDKGFVEPKQCLRCQHSAANICSDGAGQTRDDARAALQPIFFFLFLCFLFLIFIFFLYFIAAVKPASPSVGFGPSGVGLARAASRARPSTAGAAGGDRLAPPRAGRPRRCRAAAPGRRRGARKGCGGDGKKPWKGGGRPGQGRGAGTRGGSRPSGGWEIRTAPD